MTNLRNKKSYLVACNLITLLYLSLILSACSNTNLDNDPTLSVSVADESLPGLTAPPTSIQNTPTVDLIPTKTNQRPVETPTPFLKASLMPTLESQPTMIPTADPYDGLTITELTTRSYGRGQLDILDTLEANDDFTRYLITFPSDDLTIYGFMNVPNEGYLFPVVILLHGYVDPEEYETLSYTTRYADYLARAGFFVIHPNLRGFPPSDSGEDHYRTGLAIDVLNLISIIRSQSQDPLGYLRRADTDNIHLWGHSMGGGVALRVITVNNEAYIRAAVLYGSMSGDELLNYQQIKIWSEGRAGDFELSAPPSVLDQISPIGFLDRINAAVSIHHSLDDQVVPAAWSDILCQRLKALNHPVECHVYHGLPHTFRGSGDAVFMERTVDFFRRH